METMQLTKIRRWRCMLRYALLFICLFGGNSGLWADKINEIEFTNSDYTKVFQAPNETCPYFEMKMIYYDWATYHNCFWESAPEIYVDGVKVCNAAEIGQYFDGGKGDGTQAKEDAHNIDGWWGNTYDKTDTQTGISYRVRFRNPYESNTQSDYRKFSCYMRVYISNMEAGSKHKVTVKGVWWYDVYNGKPKKKITYDEKNANWEFTIPTLWDSGHQPSAEMTGYQTIKATGNLNSDVATKIGFLQSSEGTQPTSGSTYYTRKFKDPNSLEGMKPKDKGSVAYSDLTGTHTRTDAHQKEGSRTSIEYAMQLSDNGFTTYYYKWYDVSIPGFVYPKEFTKVEPNQWSKTVTLTWTKDDSGNRCNKGTWSIFRGGTFIENKPYNTNSYTVPVPEYDKEYEFKVVFVPDNSPNDKYINSLTLTKMVKVERDWSISDFVGVLEGDAIKLSWKHPKIPDASGSKKYTLMLDRRDNYADNPKWENITEIDIQSPDTEDGTYTDNKDLIQNHSYTYRLSIGILGTTITTSETDFKPVTMGGSEITAFTASRGTYSNVVKLSWSVHQVGVEDTDFILYRRPLGSTDESAWLPLENISGKATNYSYNDESVLAGNYNQYMIAIVGTNPTTGKQVIYDSDLTDGFTYSSGVVSGRITYGTGTGVEGAKVVLKQQNNDGEVTQNGGMHSLRFKDSRYTGLRYETDTTTIRQLFSSDFSVQMYLYPMFEEMAANNTRYIAFDSYNVFSLYLRTDATNKRFEIQPWTQGYKSSGIYIPGNEWSHVTVVYKSSVDSLRVIVHLADTTITNNISAGFAWSDLGKTSTSIAVANNSALNMAANYRGYLDEVRFFTKALSDKEIERNYNHPMAGNEEGLALYYPLDEGLSQQKIAYDFSKTNGISNGRHATSTLSAYSSTNLPSEELLSLMNYTDANGNYTVRGVPYSGEGTSYSIIPKKGIHEFSPTSQSRFVSTSSLVHNGVDFNDISSFPVSGKVFYANTTYPVEGVNFYVDGIACTRGGELVTTNEEGEYTISVPIGDHYIQAVKDGHVFMNNGRYPADPFKTDTCANFIQERKDLTFFDETLVNFTGRVVGGDIEGSKTLGFGLSENNIGVTELVLTPLITKYSLNNVRVVEGTVARDSTNQATLPISSATEKIASSSWRGATKSYCNNLYIRTDSQTGEFSAMVPPLQYKVSSMNVLSNPDVDFGELPTIDLSNPLLESSDTLTNDNGTTEAYTYNGVLMQTYHNPEPTFTVWQDGREDGSFGIDSYKFKDGVNDATINDIYTVGSNGTVTYNYGVKGHKAPLFMQGGTYTFLIKGYEEYKNFDKDINNPVISSVPLDGIVVTIDNALSDEQPVWMVTGEVFIDGERYEAHEGDLVDLQSDELVLDSLGRGVYEWHGGLPNVATPYTRTISMSYDINGRQYQWDGNGMEGIILGDLPSGNNFVTSGPDKLTMILRDPPGTGSSAEWTTGTTTSITKLENNTWSDNVDVGFTWGLGKDTEIVTGVITGVPNASSVACKTTKIESKDDLTTHATMENSGEKGETIETALTITEAVATSAEPDFVGADGDVFIGTATNVIYGNARHIGFMTDGTDFEIGLRNVISTSLSFGTTFSYTQSYIVNTLIPDFKMMRESVLITTTQDSINKYSPQNGVGTHNLGKDVGNLYLTTLKPSDKGYGKRENYTVVIPQLTEELPDTVKTNADLFQWYIKKKLISNDTISWINDQIDSWESYLLMNEKEKVRAFELREKEETDSLEYVNYSFDGGASRTYTWEKDSTNTSSWDWSVSAGVLIGNHVGFKIDGVGSSFDLEVTAAGGRHEAKDSVNAYTTSFAYTLAEEGSDALSVDVYRYGAFSPIFRTRGGQTSNPYEGKVVTQYYEPGTTIMEATMQIEVPQIDVDVPTVSDIPTGSAANYTLRLSNASEIGEDVTYKLFMLDETNPYGAQLTIDGKVLTEGRLIKVPGNQTLTKALQLRQTDTSILEYTGIDDEDSNLYGKGIGIVFASESQPEEIADTIFIKAYFVPSSSAVDLALSNTTINTQTGTNLQLTFSNFDRNYHNLKAFRLQYKQQGDVNWTQIHEYVLDSLAVTENNELLPKSGAKVIYTLPMASFPDGNYLFRCVSAATYGLEEVYKYSDEIALVKDMQRPRPLGQPEPSDGILSAGDEISVTFNETFLRGELTKELNFLVTGVLNGATIDHETALSMQNAETTASTEANITLAGKDFSIDTWIKIDGAGTILSHGSGANKLTVSTDASGHLVVDIAGKTYTSKDIIPTGKWAFLTLSFQNNDDGANLSGSVATANEENDLFSGLAVDKYEGVGPLAVGKNLKGAIHELLLWDEAHDLTTALTNRSKTKNPSTRHLIGYWKMDEGEGKKITDYARNRHMTMSDETWYLNNENKAVNLDGSNFMRLYTAESPYTITDDYAVELWMRAGEQTDSAQLLQAGQVALWLNAEGQLQLTGKGASSYTEESVLATSSPVLTDNAWHHVALNVLRQGAASVYVDGNRVLTTNAANVGHIATNYIYLGTRRRVELSDTGQETGYINLDRNFNGQIDEIRIWDATLNGNKLSADRKVRLTGKEKGLVAYYPFEFKTLDDYSQVVTLGSDSCFTGGIHKAEIATVSSLGLDVKPLTTYTDEAPALRTKPTETNVSFTYVASDTKVVINIDEDPATIEGCTLHFMVQDVRDENGNYSLPTVWSAFVNQNRLVWDADELTVEQPANSSTTVTATIQNNGGTMQSWTLNGIPSWMRASVTSGDTNPLAETKVTFTVTESTPIGKYEETIYLTGTDGIEVPLTIRVTVKGKEPDWAVNEKDFEGSMILIGTLEILGVPSEDSDDIVAAFVDGECRGVARPEYKQRYDHYLITMGIYGNNDELNKDVTFKAYDASTGVTYPVIVTSEDVNFLVDEMYGTPANPVILSAVDIQEQFTALAKGWNWLSLNVTLDEMTVPVVFKDISASTALVKNKNISMMNYDGTWYGQSIGLNNSEMYKVQMSQADNLHIMGKKVDPQATPITLVAGWNWVAYNGSQTISITDAMADMDPRDGDVVKGQRGTAMYDGYEWYGNLTSLVPGQGYMIKTTDARSFRYPKAVSAAGARMMNSYDEAPSHFAPVGCHLYPSNMTVVAQVLVNGVPAAGIEVGVFDKEECRAAAVTDADGLAVLTIPGDGHATMTFRVYDGSQTAACNETLPYENDAIQGSRRSPFVVSVSPTGIETLTQQDSDSMLYDLQGRRVYRQTEGIQRSTLKKGVYIEDGQKRVKK